jgi:hypothetical protein
MLRRRPAPPPARHPVAGLLCLAVLYLTAAVVTVLLAFSMAAWWPAVVAAALAGVSVTCATAAWRRLRPPFPGEFRVDRRNEIQVAGPPW